MYGEILKKGQSHGGHDVYNTLIIMYYKKEIYQEEDFCIYIIQFSFQIPGGIYLLVIEHGIYLPSVFLFMLLLFCYSSVRSV